MRWWSGETAGAGVANGQTAQASLRREDGGDGIAYRRAGYASPGSSESALETLAGLPDSRPASRRRRRESAYQMMRGHICEGQGKWLNALAQFPSTHPARPCHALRGLGRIFYPPTPLNLTRPAP